MKKNSSPILVLCLLAMLTVVASCNKLSKATTADVTIPATPDSVTLKSHVFVIDSTKLTLISTAAQLSEGMYAYTSNTGYPGFIANDIIIGITGAGYLRKVTSVMTQQNEIVLNTTQAKLEDVFLQANINFSSGVANLAGATDNGYLYNISNAVLYQDGTASATITSGSIAINANWNYNMQFQNGTMTGFSTICKGGTLNTTMQMNVTSSATDNINAATILNAARGRTIIWIGQLPIVITNNLSFTANVNGSLTGNVSRALSTTNNDTYTLGDVYATGGWQSQYSFANNSAINASAPAAAQLNVACNIVPQMQVMIYGVVCPTTSISLNTIEVGNVSTTSGDWDFSAGLTQQPAFSVAGAILGYAVPDNANSRTTDTINYKTPYRVTMVSGDGQIGTAYEYLPQPLVVQVTDNNGNAQANVPVHFAITSGGGTLSNSAVPTNSVGNGLTNWQLGNPAAASQGMQAVVKMANGTQISGSPINFIAL